MGLPEEEDGDAVGEWDSLARSEGLVGGGIEVEDV